MKLTRFQIHLFAVHPGQFRHAKSGGEKHFLLLGGKPFAEKILMWWNFIGRTHEEIVSARELWNSHDQSIPDFVDEIKVRIPAPELPNLRLNPR